MSQVFLNYFLNENITKAAKFVVNGTKGWKLYPATRDIFRNVDYKAFHSLGKKDKKIT